MYISTGGGTIGGYIAQKEAKRFVAEGEKHLASMKLVKSFPYPEDGRMKFYVLTRDGVYTAEVEAREMREQHALFPLAFTANEVLTVLRTAHERGN
ncbi:MAG TPA: hypothetical protein VFI24_08470 [Pyrinomonadaceae bacterium]|nr:hypothetical protein [Pyrinomonadaceae bacterium]